MHDMLRIMDVASALRRERETVAAQLDIDTTKARLRERLLATAVAAGEAVTAAEVDAAIELHFRSQHEYSDPPAGWGRFWALVWVLRRGLTVALCCVALVTAGVAWAVLGLVGPAGAPASAGAAGAAVTEVSAAPAVRGDEELSRLWATFEPLAAAVEVLAADDAARQRVSAGVAAGKAAFAAKATARLRQCLADLEALRSLLDEEYELRIVSRPGEKSGIDRYDARGRLVGYYVIVEAVTPDGRVLPRRIRSGETQQTTTATKWGEQVGRSTWDRIAADAQADGVVDDTRFAHKPRGAVDEVTVWQEDGKPLRRGRQITSW
jgi:hypothetical protein